ncbi:MAG: hypothetical protein M3O09_00715 [Acidobacteriota bacterium]|nr:hypothetical protein [Acidobacteriota bacterium]
MKVYINATRSTSLKKAIRAAAAHAAQAKLCLLRAARDVHDADHIRALHDVTGILSHVIVALGQLEVLR